MKLYVLEPGSNTNYKIVREFWYDWNGAISKPMIFSSMDAGGDFLRWMDESYPLWQLDECGWMIIHTDEALTKIGAKDGYMPPPAVYCGKCKGKRIPDRDGKCKDCRECIACQV